MAPRTSAFRKFSMTAALAALVVGAPAMAAFPAAPAGPDSLATAADLDGPRLACPLVPLVVDECGDTMTGSLMMSGATTNVVFTGANGVNFPGGPLRGNPLLTYGPNLVCLDSGVGCPPNNDWRLAGNAGTNPTSNFVGTTDNTPLELRANNVRGLRIEPSPLGIAGPNVIASWVGNAAKAGTFGSTIAGGGSSGNPNLVWDDFDVIGGGLANQAGRDDGNTDNQRYATIGGGWANGASGTSSTIGGGIYNAASGTDATIGGGSTNLASGDGTVVGGGGLNQATNRASTVGGGNNNVASGQWATVPGGIGNTASGIYSFAAGRNAKASIGGDFVWNDGYGPVTESTAAHQFSARASGGFRFMTNPFNAAQGCFLPGGGGQWTCSSDRGLKADVRPIDARGVLRKVAAMPISDWRYLTEPEGTRHVGPMAQDFQAVFALGEGDTQIGVLDEGGVALAAIQGLWLELEEERARNDGLEARLAALEAALGTVHS